MTPTPSQILQAIRNHRKPNHTLGARLRDAILHEQKSRGSSFGLNQKS